MKFFKRTYQIFQREVKESFMSPFVYVVSALFCFIMGALFYNYLSFGKSLTTGNLTTNILMPLFGNMNFIFLFLSPLLTMRAFSEEYKNDTIKILIYGTICYILLHGLISSLTLLKGFSKREIIFQYASYSNV